MSEEPVEIEPADEPAGTDIPGGRRSAEPPPRIDNAPVPPLTAPDDTKGG